MADQGASGEDTIRVVDLFAGCGGLTQGFHAYRRKGVEGSRFRTVAAVEWDRAAAASYGANFGHEHVANVDITEWIPGDDLGEVDVVVGGPPCQGFSALNRDGVRPERNRLWEEYVRVVEAVRPKVFVIENVDRFARSPEFADLRARVEHAGLSDYELVPPPATARGPFVLNAADYGAPQTRRRAIVFGVRKDMVARLGRSLAYPGASHVSPSQAVRSDNPTGLAPWRTADEVFEKSAMQRLVPTTEDPLPRRSSSASDFYRRTVPTSQLHLARRPGALSRARFRTIGPGGNRKSLRGRYALFFETPSEVVVERADQEPVRGADGDLEVDGTYVAVGAGDATRYVIAVDGVLEVEPRTRRPVAFAVKVQEEGSLSPVAARMHYLSTYSWDVHDSGTGDVMGRLRIGQPSVTIRTEFFKPEKGRYLHPLEDRPITHYEAALLQGFPEDFRWCGSRSDVARQIGNAVPVPLGMAIARAVDEFLSGSPAGVTPGSAPLF
ncbi:DNA cytosine methyltransferase [Cellulomonas marina]|uniref:DNA cytosine methyltransferase n=1 Tax=Cellulomonas marina TaxID=988821 RepID=UPI0015878244|nr:DNA cytosine methyltransferase [Cellulomonas marina]GIG29823.1 hypothetical protein Cma02nite_24230 [Cellulomonas marina]